MLLEGRKQPRTPERLLMQISAVRDPLLTDLAKSVRDDGGDRCGQVLRSRR